METAPPKRMSRADRRAMLLDAATRVLAKRLEPALTFETIAEEAGVSATLPYKYFESVDEIAAELYERVVGDIDTRIDELLSSDATFDDKLAQSFTMWADATLSLGPVLLALTDGRSLPSLRTRIDRRRARSTKQWAAAIEADFDIDAQDAVVVSWSITASTSAILYEWLRKRSAREQITRSYLRIARAQCEALERTTE